MPSLKEIRNRLTSVSSTRQITSAMKMVSAAKFRKAQDAIVSFRPYANILEKIIGRLGDNMSDQSDSPYFAKRQLNKVMIIVVSSNKGLCGSFNTNVIKASRLLAEEKYPEQMAAGKIDFFFIGKKAADVYKARRWPVAGVVSDLVDKTNRDKNWAFAEKLMEQFRSKEYDAIELVYNKFKNAAVQHITTETFLPLTLPETNEKPEKYRKNYIFEPDVNSILEELVPFVLKTKIHKVIIDSIASEHGARMTAMHKATDNATQLLYDLRLSYNKARQAAITNEILEIVTGANALKG
ncbi:MAG: ATP synthase F1 subunit gamma [Bacteroidetes bacterium HGW-Bacteroidetes-21]|nr:MAG: ATP synthase F1 subunit gamma [Bacteroidetes bacterium HGW-Bacteroidetes-21]